MSDKEQRAKARRLWNGWSFEQRVEFLKFHNQNIDLHKQSWMTLPYVVKELLIWIKPSIPLDPHDTPRITGKCSNCGYIYIITSHSKCPECGQSGLSWAVQEDIPELNTGDKLDVDELYRMWKMEDKRK